MNDANKSGNAERKKSLRKAPSSCMVWSRLFSWRPQNPPAYMLLPQSCSHVARLPGHLICVPPPDRLLCLSLFLPAWIIFPLHPWISSKTEGSSHLLFASAPTLWHIWPQLMWIRTLCSWYPPFTDEHYTANECQDQDLNLGATLCFSTTLPHQTTSPMERLLDSG